MKLIDYIGGKKYGKSANRLEKKAISNPFLQEAMDGYDAVRGDHFHDVQELENQFEKKIHKYSYPSRSYRKVVWPVVLSVVFIALLVGGYTIFKGREADTVPVAEASKSIFQQAISEHDADSYDEEFVNVFSAEEPIAPSATELTEKRLSRIEPDLPENSFDEEILAVAEEPTVQEPVVATTPAPEVIASAVAAPEKKSAETASSKEKEATMPATAAKEPTPKATVPEKKTVTAPSSEAPETPQPKKVQPTYRMVSGRVTDQKTGQPVSSAAIALSRNNRAIKRAQTDADGNYSIYVFEEDESGMFVVSKAGYESAKTAVSAIPSVIQMIPEAVKATKTTTPTAVKTTNGKSNYNYFEAEEFMIFFNKNRKKNICPGQGDAKVRVQFSINENGQPSNIKIESSNCEALQKEVYRLLQVSPKWTLPPQTLRLDVSI